MKLNLTIPDVARACSLKPVTIRRLEESTSLPLSNENLTKIAEVLKMDPHKLIDGANRYKDTLIEFLDRHSQEVQALIYALKPYSADQVEKIITYTLTGKHASAVLNKKTRGKSKV